MAKHMTKAEVILNMRRVSIERRTSWQTAWKAASIVAAFTLWKDCKFGAKRLAVLSADIDRMHKDYLNGNLDYNEIINHIAEINSELVTHPAWVEEKDIRARKGSFEYNLNRWYLQPTNDITEYTSMYFNFLFYYMSTRYGFKKVRLTRLYDNIHKWLKEYEIDEEKVVLARWESELKDYCGIYFEGVRVNEF